MIFRFGDYTLDIDVERTRAFYARPDIEITSEKCSCAGCQNYDKAILEAPAAVLSFFESLGIDSLDIVEMIMDLESELGVELEMEDQKIATFQELADFIESKLN